MNGHAKDEESARQAAVAMGWVDESYVWTPENPAPPGIAELAGLNRPKYDKIVFPDNVKTAIEEATQRVVADGRVDRVRMILDGRPWVCTEQEQGWLDDLIRGFELFRPRHIGGLR